MGQEHVVSSNGEAPHVGNDDHEFELLQTVSEQAVILGPVTTAIPMNCNADPEQPQDDGTSLPQQDRKRKCCRCCRTADGQSWSWKKILLGITIFTVVVIAIFFIYFRIAYKGFFTPKCAKPRKEISSMNSLDACIAEIVDQYDLMGLSVAIVTRETQDVAWTKSYGYANLETGRPVTDSTPFLLSSVSKTFIATAIMQQVETGLLDLDEDINVYLPFEVINPHLSRTSTDRITLRDLATHTSGIIDSDYAYDLYGPGDPSESLGEFLRNYFVPGGDYYSEDDNFEACLSGQCWYEYSNVGAALAAYVLEAAIGIPYAQYVEENILSPLGMTDSHFYLANYTDPNVIAMPYIHERRGPEPYGYYGYPTYPDGRLFSSSQDLSKFLVSIMLDQEAMDTTSILGIEAKKEMLTPQPFVDDKLSFTDRLFYGSLQQEIFWVQTNEITHGHDGGDYGSFTLMYFEPNQGVGVVILTNDDSLNGSIALMNIVKQVTEQSARVSELLREIGQ
jgi:CubicO group peptidase (beta-lactamase class C family)